MKPMPERGRGLAHLFGLVAHHREDALGRGERERGIDHVLEQSLSSGLVQHLGLAALHAGAESGSEDHDGYGLVHYYYYALLAARGLPVPVSSRRRRWRRDRGGSSRYGWRGCPP